MGFGVVHHLQGHGQIAGVVHIHMAVAVQVFDDRHLGLTADALNQRFAPARDDEVYKFRHGNELAHQSAVGAGHQLHGVRWQAAFSQGLPHQFGQRFVRGYGLGAATQDAGVTTFDGQAGRLNGDVGSALINHAKHTDGHAHLTHLYPAGLLAHAGDAANDVGHSRQLFAAQSHRF